MSDRKSPEKNTYSSVLLTGHDPARGSAQKVLKDSRVGSSWVRRCSKSHGSGRVESGRVGSSRVESGGFQISQVGRETLTLTRPDPTRGTP